MVLIGWPEFIPFIFNYNDQIYNFGGIKSEQLKIKGMITYLEAIWKREGVKNNV